MELIIGHLYPDLLNLYGDKGNIQCLKKRCEWRGIEVRTIEFHRDDTIDFSAADLYLIGGGTDRGQKEVCELLRKYRKEMSEFIEKNGVMLALCGAFPMLGEYYETGREKVEGLHILNIRTHWPNEYRFVDNVIVKSSLCEMPVVGFENHGGRTETGSYEEFGRVIYGSGNDGKSKKEGVHYKNLIATYLYGPLLPKNPELADYLIEKALEHKYRTPVHLDPLADEEEKNANRAIFDRFSGKESRPQDQDQL